MSANPKEYNGWSNYETWCVNLWLTNDEWTDRELSRLMREYRVEPCTCTECPECKSKTVCAECKRCARHDEHDVDCAGCDGDPDSENDVNGAATAIKDFVETNMLPDLGATMAADMLGAAMSEVDWYEIAENHMDD